MSCELTDNFVSACTVSGPNLRCKASASPLQEAHIGIKQNVSANGPRHLMLIHNEPPNQLVHIARCRNRQKTRRSECRCRFPCCKWVQPARLPQFVTCALNTSARHLRSLAPAAAACRSDASWSTITSGPWRRQQPAWRPNDHAERSSHRSTSTFAPQLLYHLRPLAAAACLAARRSMACRTASDLTFWWLRCLAASARLAVKLWCSSCAAAQAAICCLRLLGEHCTAVKILLCEGCAHAKYAHGCRCERFSEAQPPIATVATHNAQFGRARNAFADRYLVVRDVGGVVQVHLLLLAGAKGVVELLLQAVDLRRQVGAELGICRAAS